MHSNVWASFGISSLIDGYIGQSRWKIICFVWGFKFIKKDDPVLSFYCFIGMAIEILLAICFIFLLSGSR